MISDAPRTIPEQDRCQECHIRYAKKLCDFALGESRVSFYRDYHKFKKQDLGLITCDKLLCDDCANRFFAMDMCNEHYKTITGGCR